MRALIFYFVLFLALTQSAQADLKEALALGQFDRAENFNPEMTALREAGISVGMYHGYVSETEKINNLLLRNATNLDKAYNFRNLLIGDNVLPPVIIKAKNLHLAESDLKYKEAAYIYRIRARSKVLYNTPTWRDYLVLSHSSITEPVLMSDLKPKKKKEKEAWQNAVKAGYEKGVEHARELFSYNFNKLNEEFLGMLLALELDSLNMIDLSTLSRTNLGNVVTDDAININQVEGKLNLRDSFTPSDNWKPFVKVRERVK